VTTLKIVQAVGIYGVLAWLLYLSVRAPKNVPLRCLTALVACWAIAYPFGLAAGTDSAFLVGDPFISQTVSSALLLVAAYCLICFFLFTSHEPRQARRRAWVQVIPLAVALTVLLGSVLATPEALHPLAAVATKELLRGHDFTSVPSIGIFYIVNNCYSAFAFGTAFVLTLRYSRQAAARRLRQGMAITAVGSASICTASLIFIAANIFLWSGHPGAMPRWLVLLGDVLVLGGLVVFFGGLAYRGIATRLEATWLWWQHLRSYHQLRPLWTILHEEFPEDVLSRVPETPMRDVLSLRGVHRRYYRRAIECRDGLVRVSPYLADGRGSGDQDASGYGDLAGRVKTALRAHAAGVSAPSRAVPVALPSRAGLDADVQELVALSRAMRAL
jgi:hypothetical protein